MLIHLHFGGRSQSRVSSLLRLLFRLCCQRLAVVDEHAISALDLLRANLVDAALL